MKKFLLYMLATLGGIFSLLLIVLFFVGKSLFFEKVEPIPDYTILTLHLGKKFISDHGSPPGILPLIRSKDLALDEILNVIKKAEKDNRIKALLLFVEGESLGFAQVQEIRDALIQFRTTGKRVVAFSDTFGDSGSCMRSYYLATAADQIWLQPGGDFNFSGFMAELPFAKKALDDWKLKQSVIKREEYKSAPETFTETDFTKASKENLEAILKSFFEVLTKDVGTARNLDPSEVKEIIDESPLLGEKALEKKMIDRIGYLDELKASFFEVFGQKSAYLKAYAYLRRLESDEKLNTKEKKEEPTLAIIYAEGSIVRSADQEDSFSQDFLIEDTVISKAIRKAVEDKDVKGIVLRINSGGGSSVASETIWREVKLAKESGKPIVISMGDAAASGGYFIAAPANKIVAQPMTLTGSIGVFTGKMVTGKFWRHYGVNWGHVKLGKNAGIWSSDEDFSKEGLKKVNDSVDEIYKRFIEKVALGRGMPFEKAAPLAKGRVWTGKEALNLGLVDALGGIQTAIDMTKELAGIAKEGEVNLKIYPKEKTVWDLLFNIVLDGEEEDISFFKPLMRLQGLFSKASSMMSIMTPRQELESEKIQIR